MKRNRICALLLTALFVFAAMPAMAAWEVAHGVAGDYKTSTDLPATVNIVSLTAWEAEQKNFVKASRQAGVNSAVEVQDGLVRVKTSVVDTYLAGRTSPGIQRPAVFYITGAGFPTGGNKTGAAAAGRSIAVMHPLDPGFAGKKPDELKVVKVFGSTNFVEYNVAYAKNGLADKFFLVISGDDPVQPAQTISAGNKVIVYFTVSGDFDVGSDDHTIDPLFIVAPAGPTATPTPTGTLTPTPTGTVTPTPTGTVTPTPTPESDLEPVPVPSGLKDLLPSGILSPSVETPTSDLPAGYSNLVSQIGGRLYLKSAVLENIAPKVGGKAVDAMTLPVFKASVATGGTAAFAFSISTGNSSEQTLVSEIRVVKVKGENSYLEFAPVYRASDLADGKCMIVSSDGKTARQRGDAIRQGDLLVLVIKDGGNFDMDTRSTIIIDPCFAIKTRSSGSSSGGCVTGSFAPAAMLMVIPLLGVFLAGRK